MKKTVVTIFCKLILQYEAKVDLYIMQVHIFMNKSAQKMFA